MRIRCRESLSRQLVPGIEPGYVLAEKRMSLRPEILRLVEDIEVQVDLVTAELRFVGYGRTAGRTVAAHDPLG